MVRNLGLLKIVLRPQPWVTKQFKGYPITFLGVGVSYKRKMPFPSFRTKCSCVLLCLVVMCCALLCFFFCVSLCLVVVCCP